MKRILSMILCFALLAVLAGCIMIDDNTNSTFAGKQDTSTPPGTFSAVVPPIVFQEQVVVDNEYCTIKITGIDEDNLFGYTLKVFLENKSENTTYMISVDNASINGVQADPFFAKEVAPGKKANAEISFSSQFSQGNDIGVYSDIALSFRVYDTNDWLADPVATPSTHIYPLGQENTIQYSRTPLDTDLVLVDNAYATVIATGFRTDEIWGYTVDLFLINKTNTTALFTVDEVSVNGFMIDPFYADSVGSGLCAFSSISWSENSFEDNNIVSVENIEFLLRIYDEENWLNDDFVSQKITITP